MNNTTNININDLITTDKKLNQCIKSLDYKSTKHRQLVIQVIEQYIKKYVTPALYLMPDIDLDRVFGKIITGIALQAEFHVKRENLDRPSDEELDYVLEIIIDLEPTLELRNKFWDSWLVGESFLCIISLCNFLKKPLIFKQNQEIKPNFLKKEIKQIEYILTLEMTPNIEEWIKNILKIEQEALAEWNKEETTF